MTELSRQRRGEIEEDLGERGVHALESMTPRELRALLRDSAWRERVEPQVRELADSWSNGVGPTRILAKELRAIVDTGDEEDSHD